VYTKVYTGGAIAQAAKHLSTLKMEEICPSERSVDLRRSTRHCITEGSYLRMREWLGDVKGRGRNEQRLLQTPLLVTGKTQLSCQEPKLQEQKSLCLKEH
jgi:hypothetical protein